MDRTDVRRCGVVYSLLQSTVSVACWIRKNEATISLSERLRAMNKRPEIDGSNDGKAYNESQGIGAAPAAGFMRQ